MSDPTPPVLRLTRHIKAAPQAVFNAWTDARHVARWLSPDETIRQVVTELDARVGGTFRFGYANPDTGHVNTVTGRYVEVDPPRRLVFTWTWLPPHDEFPDDQLRFESRVTVELHGLDGGTQLTLTHKGLPPGPIADRHAWGWNGTLDRLLVFAGPCTGTVQTQGQ